jgi:tRNA-specific 2-thiouridylase
LIRVSSLGVRDSWFVMAKNKQKVFVAMSGGVDSSVTAGLLKEAGYNCTGVFMCFGQPVRRGQSHKACCSPEDAQDAREVSQCLGIEFVVLNFQQDMGKIVDYFVNEYKQGRTPNPCILCNSMLKFGKLMEYASLIDADYVATGHYAQVLNIDGQMRLSRGVDKSKDQSYALFNIPQRNLKRIMLPLGGYTKTRVRQLAAKMNLPVKDKAESQEICFVGDNDYARLVSERAREVCVPGDVIDSQGRKLGEHTGIYQYTVGQRRGLGIAAGEPMYVIRLDKTTNTVVLGTQADLMKKQFVVDKINWLVEEPPVKPFRAVIQIRYNHRGAPGMVTPISTGNDTVTQAMVDFDEPVSAITPGQAAGFYDAEQNVVGGGWIDKVAD